MKKTDYKGTSFSEFFREQMEDRGFKEEWDRFQPEFQVMRAIAAARIDRDISQKELAELTGIDQSEISRIENGERNPSVRILKRIADAMDMDLKIEFVPRS